MRRVAVGAGIACLAFAANAVALPSMTKSDARRLAAAVQLTGSDLSGWDEAPADNSTDSRGDKRLSRCAGTVPDSKALATVQSDQFSRTVNGVFQQLNSQAIVYPNAGLVKKDLKASRTKRARACLQKALRGQSTGDPNMKLLSVTVSPMKPAVRNGVGVRVKSVYETPKGKVTLYTDALIVGTQNVEGGVVVTSGSTPTPRNQENDFLKIVTTRVKSELAGGGA